MSTGHRRDPIYHIMEGSTASKITHTLKEDGVAVDLSAAAGNLYLQVRDSSHTAVETNLAASWVTDGSDGQIEVRATANMVSQPRDLKCNWEINGYDGFTLVTFPFILRVVPSAKVS